MKRETEEHREAPAHCDIPPRNTLPCGCPNGPLADFVDARPCPHIAREEDG